MQTGLADKYRGFIDLESDIHAYDLMPSIIAGFAYLRGVVAGLGLESHR